MKINTKIVLCDIEGTTTAISFVKDTLFPYSKKFAQQFITDNWNSLFEKKILHQLTELPEYPGDRSAKLNETMIPEIAKFVDFLVDADSKVGPLKTLQGLIWEKGFSDGTIKGHVFQDVPAAFKLWTDNGVKIYIYSSGSVHAQEQLFKNSVYGNLLNFISGHFDTKIGNKRETQSYKNILLDLKISASDVVFLTDIVAEADAASEIQIKTILLDRPGNTDLSEMNRKHFTVLKSFDEIEICPV